MKKIFYLLTIVSLFAFTSCEDADIEDIVNQLSGNATMVTNHADSSFFNVCGGTYMDTTIMVNQSPKDINQTVILASKGTLESVSYPYLFCIIQGNSVGSYPININTEYALSMDIDDLSSINNNIVAMAKNEDTIFFINNGTINITSFEGLGGLIKGNYYGSGYFFIRGNNASLSPVSNLSGKFEARHLNLSILGL